MVSHGIARPAASVSTRVPHDDDDDGLLYSCCDLVLLLITLVGVCVVDMAGVCVLCVVGVCGLVCGCGGWWACASSHL
jgi:hypothetical protein